MSTNHSFLSFLSMLNQTTDSRFIFFQHRKTLKTRIFYENKPFVSFVSFDVKSNNLNRSKFPVVNHRITNFS